MTRRDMLERDGCIVVQNVFSAAETECLRETLLTHFSQLRPHQSYVGRHESL